MKISNLNMHKFIGFGVFSVLFMRFLTDNLNFPYFVMPVFDLFFLILVLIGIVLKTKKTYSLKPVRIWGFLFIAVVVLSIIINGGTSFSDFFYEVRPYLRMIIGIYLATAYMKLNNYEKMYRFIKWLLYLNVVVMIFQYVFWGLRQDTIGGTFGNNQGVNAIQNLLCIILFAVSINKYLYRQIRLKEMTLNTVVVLVIAVLAEINFLFLEVAIVGFLSLIISNYRNNRLSFRKMLLIMAGLIGGILAIRLFLYINPERAFLLSTNAILEYLGAYGGTGVYRISRMRVFSQLGKRFFDGDVLRMLFGYGVGNCSVHSSFYDTYSFLQYDYFSSSMVFLQSGLLGVFVNLGLLLFSLKYAVVHKIKSQFVKLIMWKDIGINFVIICLLLFFYNTTLRDIYTAYLAGVFIALPFVIAKEARQA